MEIDKHFLNSSESSIGNKTLLLQTVSTSYPQTELTILFPEVSIQTKEKVTDVEILREDLYKLIYSLAIQSDCLFLET